MELEFFAAEKAKADTTNIMMKYKILIESKGTCVTENTDKIVPSSSKEEMSEY